MEIVKFYLSKNHKLTDEFLIKTHKQINILLTTSIHHEAQVYCRCSGAEIYVSSSGALDVLIYPAKIYLFKIFRNTTYFTYFSGVSIVDSEQVNVSWLNAALN